MAIREEKREGQDLLILYWLDTVNQYNATRLTGYIVWVRYREPIQWPLEKRKEKRERQDLLILYWLDTVN